MTRVMANANSAAHRILLMLSLVIVFTLTLSSVQAQTIKAIQASLKTNGPPGSEIRTAKAQVLTVR